MPDEIPHELPTYVKRIVIPKRRSQAEIDEEWALRHGCVAHKTKKARQAGGFTLHRNPLHGSSLLANRGLREREEIEKRLFGHTSGTTPYHYHETPLSLLQRIHQHQHQQWRSLSEAVEDEESDEEGHYVDDDITSLAAYSSDEDAESEEDDKEREDREVEERWRSLLAEPPAFLRTAEEEIAQQHEGGALRLFLRRPDDISTSPSVTQTQRDQLNEEERYILEHYNECSSSSGSSCSNSEDEDDDESSEEEEEGERIPLSSLPPPFMRERSKESLSHERRRRTSQPFSEEEHSDSSPFHDHLYFGFREGVDQDAEVISSEEENHDEEEKEEDRGDDGVVNDDDVEGHRKEDLIYCHASDEEEEETPSSSTTNKQELLASSSTYRSRNHSKHISFADEEEN
ncbi:hypothetical protein QOT17_007033 [Balamuthia mandrillaris]